jgi:hypothetical protein
LNLAECHRREGRAASAWTEFNQALAQARRDGRTDRADVATSRITELEPQLSRLSIVIGPAADRADLTVTLDRSAVRRPAWGSAVPLDPGTHSIEASAPGMKSWSASVTIKSGGDAQSISVPPLEQAPPAPAPLPEPPAPTPDRPAPSSRAVPLWRDGAMIGAAVVGIGGVALGSYFGLNAISLNQRAASECPAGKCTNDAATTSGRANSSADASTVSFAVGAAGVAGAAVLFFTRRANVGGGVTMGASPTSAWVAWTAHF